MIRARTERELVVAPSNKTVQANNHDKKVTDTPMAAPNKKPQRITSATKMCVSARYRSAERLRVKLDVLSPGTTATILSVQFLMNPQGCALYESRRK